MQKLPQNSRNSQNSSHNQSPYQQQHQNTAQHQTAKPHPYDSHTYQHQTNLQVQAPAGSRTKHISNSSTATSNSSKFGMNRQLASPPPPHSSNQFNSSAAANLLRRIKSYNKPPSENKSTSAINNNSATNSSSNGVSAYPLDVDALMLQQQGEAPSDYNLDNSQLSAAEVTFKQYPRGELCVYVNDNKSENGISNTNLTKLNNTNTIQPQTNPDNTSYNEQTSTPYTPNLKNTNNLAAAVAAAASMYPPPPPQLQYDDAQLAIYYQQMAQLATVNIAALQHTPAQQQYQQQQQQKQNRQQEHQQRQKQTSSNFYTSPQHFLPFLPFNAQSIQQNQQLNHQQVQNHLQTHLNNQNIPPNQNIPTSLPANIHSNFENLTLSHARPQQTANQSNNQSGKFSHNQQTTKVQSPCVQSPPPPRTSPPGVKHLSNEQQALSEEIPDISGPKSLSIPGLYSRDEYKPILEIYDIPSDLKSEDIEQIFTQYPEFYVRWVDDNHALGIFSIASHAGQALRENKEQVHTDAGQVVKLRTLNQAGRLTQLKAQRLIDQIIMEQANTLPSVERPQTSAVIAKRLISGHLGLGKNKD